MRLDKWLAVALVCSTASIWGQAARGALPTTPPNAAAGSLVMSPAPTGKAIDAPAIAFPDASAPCPVDPPCPKGPCVWGSIETLFWHVKSSPVVPLVTINPDPNSIASLAQPGTTVVFGGSPIDFGSIAGVRGTLGGWIYDRSVGVEGSIFGLPTQGKTFTVASGGANSPVIAVPINSTVPFGFNAAGETTLNPGNTPSVIRVNATTQLFGAEALGLASLVNSPNCYVTVLGGFKYIDLRESITVDQVFLDTLAPGNLSVHDGFTSRNQFYGATAGLRGGTMLWGCVGLEMTGKLSMGPVQQEYTAAGATTATGTPFGINPGSAASGILALPSNSGSFTRNEFIIIPEGQAKLSVDLFSNLRLFVAYDFLYMSSVVRASSQIDRNVNPTQNPFFLTATGTPAPLPSFNRTDFWAQGVSAAVRFSF